MISFKLSKLVIIFFLLLLIKIISVSVLSESRKCLSDQKLNTILAVNSGDTPSYIGAMENFIQSGEYYWYNGDEKVRAGRLPHYSIPYFLFRQFFDEKDSKDLVVVTQILLECIAIILISIVIGELTGFSIYYYLSIFVFSISLRWTNYANYLSPESLGISLLMIGFFYFHRYRQSQSKTHLLLTGAMVALSGLMKPYMLVIFLPIGLYFIEKVQFNLDGARKVLINTLIVSLPLVILLAPWIVRNYNIYDRIVPLQVDMRAGYRYSSADLAVRQYIQSWGGNFIFWDPNSAGCFFEAREDFPCNFTIPDVLVTNSVSKEDIVTARNRFLEAKASNDSIKESAVVSQFNLMARDFKSQNSFYYHFIAPLKLTKTFLIHSGSYYVPFLKKSECSSSFLWYIKLLQSALYYLTLIIGFAGLIILAFRPREYIYLFVPVFLIVFFPVIIRAVEWRYFNASYPVLVLGTIYLVHFIFSHRLSQKLPKLFS